MTEQVRMRAQLPHERDEGRHYRIERHFFNERNSKDMVLSILRAYREL